MRGLALALTAIAMLAFAATPPAAAQVSIVVGGQPLVVNPGPIERNGRVFVPMRAIFERLGATVVYSSGNINATRGQTTVALTIGSTQAVVNGQSQTLDVAPFIVGASTYVPLRFIAQSLGAVVNYNDSNQQVTINMGHMPPPRPVPPPPNPNPPPPPPEIQLYAQRPVPGNAVADRFVTISAQFNRNARPGTVRVWLDGNDITGRCAISAGGFSYRPPAPLSFGAHRVRVAGLAADGSGFDRAWSFTTSGAPPPVSPIDLNSQNPAPGANVTNRFVTISANFSRQVDGSSVRVFIDGVNRSNQSGISGSGFSFKPPAPLDFGSHKVRVTGNGIGGLAFDRSWNFTVIRSAPAIHLTITQPIANAPVGQTFTIRGNTVANGRIAVTAGASPDTTGQFSGNTTAGPAGNFSISVSLNTLMGQSSVKVRITATDPATGATTSQVLQLRLRS